MRSERRSGRPTRRGAEGCRRRGSETRPIVDLRPSEKPEVDIPERGKKVVRRHPRHPMLMSSPLRGGFAVNEDHGPDALHCCE